jgi:hypothetical protein
MQSITQWFEVYNKEHLLAFRHYIKHGQWPLGFDLPPDVRLNVDWDKKLAMRVAVFLIEVQCEPTYNEEPTTVAEVGC